MTNALARRAKFDRIEKRRVAARVSQERVALAAGIGKRAYIGMKKGEYLPRQSTLKKLERAIRRLEAVRDQVLADRMIACVFSAHFLVLASELDLDGSGLLRVDPRDRSAPGFSDANKLRALAAYMTITGLDLMAIEVAAAVGVTKQAMSKWLVKVEDLRDDPQVDALLDRLAEALGTETGW